MDALVSDLKGPDAEGWWLVSFTEPPLPGLLGRYVDPDMKIEYRVQLRQVPIDDLTPAGVYQS